MRGVSRLACGDVRGGEEDIRRALEGMPDSAGVELRDLLDHARAQEAAASGDDAIRLSPPLSQ